MPDCINDSPRAVLKIFLALFSVVAAGLVKLFFDPANFDMLFVELLVVVFPVEELGFEAEVVPNLLLFRSAC